MFQLATGRGWTCKSIGYVSFLPLKSQESYLVVVCDGDEGFFISLPQTPFSLEVVGYLKAIVIGCTARALHRAPD